MCGADGAAGHPVEDLAREQGYEVVDAPHCRRGWWVQVGQRVLFMVPTWAPGAGFREGEIGRLLVLYRLAACGRAHFGQALGAMRRAYAARLAGDVPGVLPALTDLGEVAAD